MTSSAHLISFTLVKAAPLILAAFGGLLSELAGVVNFALEGMMLMGAFFAVWATFVSGSPWIGLMAGTAGGMIIGVLHGIATLGWRANHIVSSIALNLLAAGLTGMLLNEVFDVYGTSPSVASLPRLHAAGLPGAAGGVSILVPVSLGLGLLIAAMIRWSVWGLRVLACGENPLAAGAAGISLFHLRFGSVVLGGALAGMGGAYLSIGELSQFVENMTRGRGYLAVAAVVLGRWKPLGVMAAALLFGGSEALSEWLSVEWPGFPYQVFLMIPYVMCLLVLMARLGRRRPPSSLGHL